jgi:hypothetical protein
MKKFFVILFSAFLILSGCGVNEKTAINNGTPMASNLITKTYEITGIT